jgi:hypothetical protein
MAGSVSYCRNCGKYVEPGRPHRPAATLGTCLVPPSKADGYDGPASMVPTPEQIKAVRDELDAAEVPDGVNLLVPPCETDPDADVKNPKHYNRFKIEPLTFIEENGLSYSQGNVIKYVCRFDAKDGVRDLKKAREYIDKMIERAEREGA